MKKFLITILFGLLLLSCQKQRKVSEIKYWISKTDSRTDLIESITEFESEINGMDATGGFDIHTIMDKDSVIQKVFVNVAISNDSLMDYEFYFQKDTVIFANIRAYKENGPDGQKLDTLTDSDFYFENGDLLERIDRKKTDLEIETVKWLAEMYFIFSRDYE
ncbi:hypothetical protein [Croceivirga radicis]|uniref:hypothetical protein n=1 Tax=Croceivirga radicis TaxID=1929488 RepID=UPI000255AFCA|nr:hypothetical protein [Croceivirga radicis]